jgi:phosphoribosylformimino-5-aminoimidazole carboxamide ribotide isomerase
MMDIFPAIDLRQGRVVRLRHGDPNQQTVFSDDPTAVAHQWANEGAKWLHVVNLDGALEDQTAAQANLDALREITAVGPAVQFGGGLRSLTDIEKALEMGVTRVVLGTMAIERPDILQTALARFGPERVVVGLDARDGRVAIRGWQEESGLEVTAVGQQMRAMGLTTALHTDIGRDGDLRGVNGPASSGLAQATGLQVIASGGVANLADVRALLPLPGVCGVVVGRALYEGRVSLRELLAVSR